MTLDELRRELDRIDTQLIEAIAARQRISADIAEAKRSAGTPTRDFQRERAVLLGARERAERAGAPPDVAEAILRVLIRASLTTQEQARVVAQGGGAGQRALVIGGAGRMGRWFAEFLLSQGFAVGIADPAALAAGANGVAGAAAVPDWQTGELDHDFIVVATPLAVTDGILQALALQKPRGVIFDLASVKAPCRGGLLALKAAGCRVTSLHPMFGPDTELLSGRHVLFVDLAAGDALVRARALFASTMVEQVVTNLEEHDRLIAYVLGLSHALNIAFFTALAGSGETAPKLAQLSSTTFDAQLAVAAEVAGESADVFYEIQRLNEHGAGALDSLAEALDRLRTAIERSDRAAFAQLMQRGRDYLRARRDY